MAHWAWYLIGAVGLAVLYDQSLTPKQKREWEDKIKMHHGEAGVLLALAGLLTESPRLTATGIGLAVHDINDSNKWFTGDKQNSM